MVEYLLILVVHVAGADHVHELKLYRQPDLESCYAYGLAKQELHGSDKFQCIPVTPLEE